MRSVKVSVPTPATFTVALKGTFTTQGAQLGSKGATLDVSPTKVRVTKASLKTVPFSAPDPWRFPYR